MLLNRLITNRTITSILKHICFLILMMDLELWLQSQFFIISMQLISWKPTLCLLFWRLRWIFRNIIFLLLKVGCWWWWQIVETVFLDTNISHSMNSSNIGHLLLKNFRFDLINTISIRIFCWIKLGFLSLSRFWIMLLDSGIKCFFEKSDLIIFSFIGFLKVLN